MLLSNRLTYCITTFILMAAFVALPVMAHQLPAAPTSATQAEKDAVDDHNNGPHDPADTDVSADHALVESIEVSEMYLTTAAPITAIITLADGVAAIEDDTDTDDNVATTGNDNEARHGILPNLGSDLVSGSISIEFGTMNDDGEYEYAVLVAPDTGPQVTNIIKTGPEGAGDTGSGAVYTVYISVPATLEGAANGMYKISVDVTGVSQPDTATATDTFTMDVIAPTVGNVCLLYTSPSPRDS